MQCGKERTPVVLPKSLSYRLSLREGKAERNTGNITTNREEEWSVLQESGGGAWLHSEQLYKDGDNWKTL